MPPCDEVVHIRRAREEDARGIAEVHVQTWREAYRDQLPTAFLSELRIDARESCWQQELRVLAPDRCPWVAEARGQILGFVASGISREEHARRGEGEVYAIYVLPDCWARGVGRSLLAHAEHDLLNHGYSEAILWVIAENVRARYFYEQAGWQVDGGSKIQQIGGQDVAEVRYRITLDKSRVGELV